MTKQVGTVKWFNPVKGFGFITPQEGGDDLFVHQSVIHAENFRSLADGETVEFSVESDAEGRSKAVDVTGPDGGFVQGKPKKVSRSRSRGGAAGGRGRGRGRGRGPRADGENGEDDEEAAESSGLQVVVHNLPWSYAWQALRDLFVDCGEVQRADIITDPYGRSRGFGTVRFSTTEAANSAIEKINDTEIEGRQISVRLDKYA